MILTSLTDKKYKLTLKVQALDIDFIAFLNTL